MISFAEKLETDAEARALTLKLLNRAMVIAALASASLLGYISWILL